MRIHTYMYVSVYTNLEQRETTKTICRPLLASPCRYKQEGEIDREDHNSELQL